VITLGLAFASPWRGKGAAAAGPEPAARPPAAGLPEPSASLPPAEPVIAKHSETGLAPVDLERERALNFLARLEQIGAGQEEQRAQESAGARAALARIVEFQHQLGGLRDPAAADQLYEAVVSELKQARPRLRSALVTWRAPSAVPTYTSSLEFSALADLAEAPGVEELRALEVRIAEYGTTLREQERAARWSAVELRARRVGRLNTLRLEAIRRLSATDRSRVLGVSGKGIEQFGRELEQVALSAQYYLAARGRGLRHLSGLVRDGPALGSASYVVLRLGLVLTLALYLSARGASILEGLRTVFFRSSRGVEGARRSRVLLEALKAFAPWTLFLLALEGTRWALGDAVRWPEVDLAYRVARLYGFYRLALDALHGFLLRVAHRYHLKIEPGRRDKLLGSARTLMRVCFGVAALLSLSEQLLGQGYLYHLVRRFAWLVVALALLRILVGWQTILVESYLASRPEGRRAALVRATRDHWYGVFVAAASFVWLVGQALVVLARDFALGFDQTRRAMAFLFRRRVEKEAERRGYSESEVEALPAKLIEAFAEDPVSAEELLVDNFPGTDLLRSALGQWMEGEVGGSFVITGERGIGKTTWLGRVGIEGLAPQRVTLDQRLLDAPELVGFFARVLGCPEKPTPDLGGLTRWLAEGDRRLVLVDLGQNLFLGTVGGYRGFEAFVSLVEATCQRVFWVCAINTFAWEHLSAVRPDLRVFRFHTALPGWTEAQIRELIRTRTAASGVRLTYDDLLLGPLEGVSGHGRFLETEEGYTRLLWGYSDGNPRVALHYWLRSLVPEPGGQARVRLCQMPEPSALQDVGEAGLFLLAAIVLHENLTLAEAMAVTRDPEPLCRITLGRLLELGALKVDNGRYRVTTHWHRAAVRLLKRLNLLPD